MPAMLQIRSCRQYISPVLPHIHILDQDNLPNNNQKIFYPLKQSSRTHHLATHDFKTQFKSHVTNLSRTIEALVLLITSSTRDCSEDNNMTQSPRFAHHVPVGILQEPISGFGIKRRYRG